MHHTAPFINSLSNGGCSYHYSKSKFINHANQELNVWLKPNNSMCFSRWLKPTAIDIDDHRINCRLL